jgi:hypothetical protein
MARPGFPVTCASPSALTAPAAARRVGRRDAWPDRSRATVRSWPAGAAREAGVLRAGPWSESGPRTGPPQPLSSAHAGSRLKVPRRALTTRPNRGPRREDRYAPAPAGGSFAGLAGALAFARPRRRPRPHAAAAGSLGDERAPAVDSPSFCLIGAGPKHLISA